ncbi:MAG TPA: hypothetical protein VFD03_09470 [Clostridia bacterium]|nr:hypothetical protein [Clostridia bacterium]
MGNSADFSNLSDAAKAALIKRLTAEIETLKFKLSKYENLTVNQEHDEIAEIQARLSGTRGRVIYSGNETLDMNQESDDNAATQARLSGTRTLINYNTGR